MAQSINDIRSQIESQLAELEAEIAPLQKALEALGDSPNTESESEQRPAKPKKSSSRRVKQVKQERVQSTADAIIELTELGFKPKRIAEKLNVSIGYVYLIRRQSLQAA